MTQTMHLCVWKKISSHSNIYCAVFVFLFFVFVFCFVFLCLVNPMLLVSLDYLFLIAPSVLPNGYLYWNYISTLSLISNIGLSFSFTR